jgi:pilus assembly protein FimV
MLARFKVLFTFLVFLGSFVSGTVFALSLGEISLNSRVNEVLDANIELLELDGIEAVDIVISMGSQADFDLVDLERPAFLDQIQFEVQILSSDDGIVVLSTTEDITDPFLRIILNVSSPSGSFIRGYTIDMDSPTFTQDNPATPAAPVPPQTGGGGDNVVIEQGDTLWQVALESRDNNSVSVQQMMLAIQRANSDAFINNNINRIRTGAVLRIPTSQEVLSLTAQQAFSQVAIQNQQISALGPQPISANTGGVTAAVSDQGDELSVLTDAGNSQQNVIAGLENELAMSEEGLDRARIENEDLNGRLADLQTEIEILQNIIAIEDERVAQLQIELAEQAEVATQAVADAQLVAQQVQDTIDTSEPVDTSLAGLVRALSQNTWAMLAILWSLVALVIGFLIWRSRKAGASEDEEFDPDFASGDEGEDDIEALSESSEAEQEDTFEDDISEFNLEPESDDIEEEIENSEYEAGIATEAETEVAFDLNAIEDEIDDEIEDEIEDETEGETEELTDIEEAELEEEESAEEEVFEFESSSFNIDDTDTDTDTGSSNEEVETISEQESNSEEPDESVDFSVHEFYESESEEESESEVEKVKDEEDAAVEPEAYDFSEVNNDDKPAEASATEGVEVEVATEMASESTNEDDEPEVYNFSVSEDSDPVEIDLDESADIVDVALQDGSSTAEEEPEVYDFSVEVPVADSGDEKATMAESGQAEESVESFEFSLPELDQNETAEDDTDNAIEPESDVEVLSFSASSDEQAEEARDSDSAVNSSVDGSEDSTETIEIEIDTGTDSDSAEDFIDFGDLGVDDSFSDEDIVIEDDAMEDDAMEDEDILSAITDEKDESSTKLDLAVAYEAMGDLSGAREILAEVIAEGDEAKAAEAKKLLEAWDGSPDSD